MKPPTLRHNELYLLGLLLAECDDHIGSVFNLSKLATDSFSVPDIRVSAKILDELGLASLSSMTTPGQRRADDMLMLTPLGFTYCLQYETRVLNAVLDGGAIDRTQSVRDAFSRFRLDAEHSFRWMDVDPPLPELENGMTIPSSSWTGLPANFQLTSTKQSHIVRLLNEAEQNLERAGLSNVECAQAKAFLKSALILMDAPEPQPDLAWELIQRAGALAAVGQLLVAVIALFLAK